MLVAFHKGRSSVYLTAEEVPDKEKSQNKSLITRLIEYGPQKGGYDLEGARSGCSGANKACTSPPALVFVAQSYGISVNEHSNWTIEQLVAALRAGKPVLVSNRLNLSKSGPAHYFVVVGVLGEDVVYNDSYYYSSQWSSGKEKRGKLKDFMDAWYTNIDKDKDPTNMAGWNGWGMAAQ
jgi:uncharacterized protein YvpB